MSIRKLFPARYMAVSLLVFGASSASPAFSEILWDGSFANGDYNGWMWREPANGNIRFWGMNEALRPIRYSDEQSNPVHIGNGVQSGIVHKDGITVAKSFGNVNYPQGPVRHGDYAARITVRNSVNGSEPQDCGESDNGRCTYRRTEVWTWANRDGNYMAHHLNAWPQFQERWLSFSVFFPADFAMSPASGSWWPSVLQIKPRWGGWSMSPTLELGIHPQNGWQITHRTHPEITNKLIQHGQTRAGHYNYDYAHDMRYSSTSGMGFQDHLAVDFPDPGASREALRSIALGQWTDWVFQIKADPRGPREGGTGFLRAWKRVGTGEWVQVLDIEPREFNVGGYQLKRGVFFNDPGGSSGNANSVPGDWERTLVNFSGAKYSEQNGGFSVMAGFYGRKSFFWDAPRNVTMFIDNIRLGSDRANLLMMTPSSTLRQEPAPKPPITTVN